MRSKYKELVETYVNRGLSETSAKSFAINDLERLRANFNPHSIIDMEEDEAAKVLFENGYYLSIDKRNGEWVGSGDLVFRSSRVCVDLNKEGKIVATRIG